jgi:predicted nucleic acid-binding protein
MKRYIWDTGAISLYFAAHEKAKKFMNDIEKGIAKGYISTSILAEYYYKAIQKYGKQAAQVQVITLMNSSLEEITISKDNVFKIGELKVKHHKLSYIDSLVITLGLQKNAILLTTDQYIKDRKLIKTIKFDY